MRYLKLALCLVAVAAIATTLVPTSAFGVECLQCDVNMIQGVWGQGATCYAASLDLHSQAAAIPGPFCNQNWAGQCGTTTTTETSSCYNANGQKVIDGNVRFSCFSGDTGPCGPGGGRPPM